MSSCDSATRSRSAPSARVASSAVRAIACLAVLASLAACATRPQVSATQEAAQYASRARRNYTPPGPASDPWGPYIVEASAKYDMPERWIREVIRAESGGRMYEKGTLITSDAGAMGLMQVMPATFDELRARYSLGDDPYDPHDNIMAGSAYLRELYDAYGSPAFLAAYNAGPGRLEDYLSRNKPLPAETRNYVAKIGPNILDTQPQRLSSAGQLAMNQIPIYIPAGPRYPRSGRYGAPVALADRGGNGRGPGRVREPVQTAALVEPPRYIPPSRDNSAQLYAANPPPPRGGFHLIPPAMADTVPLRRGGGTTGNWAIQVGAFGNEGMARAAADAARGQARELAAARSQVGTVRQARATLYRARLTGLSHEAAVQACERISHGRGSCIVVSPDSQS
jgi:hypothetical protein